MLNTTSFGKKALATDNFLRMAVCSFFFLFCVNTAQSKGIPLFFNWGTEICVVKEMPDDYMIQTTDYGVIHVNLGVAYNEFSLFGIPLWNWDVEKYILLPDNYDSLDKGNYVFYNIDAEELRRIKQLVGDLPETPELSFWRSYGGKLIFLPFIILLLIGLFTPSNNTERKKQVGEQK